MEGFEMKNVVFIFSTAEEDKLLAGMTYAKNALKNKWFHDIKIFLFGPSEKTVVKSEKLRKILNELEQLGAFTTACKALSEKIDISKELLSAGIKVDFVGEPISQLINSGYIPLIY
jgi:hypothetical protein